MRTFHLFRLASVVFVVMGWCSAAGYAQVKGMASAGASTSPNGSVQQPSASGVVNAGGSGAGLNANGAARGGASAPVSQMQAELATKVDSKTAKAGDVVEAKTTKTVTMADGTVIPKGSKLVGTVTQVHAQEKGQAESSLALSFDRVRLRGGQEVMLRSTIDNVSSPAGMTAEGDAGIDDMIGAGPVAASSPAGGRGGLAAAGVVGGVAGGATGSLARTGNILGSTAQGTSNLTRSSAQGVGSSVDGAANSSVSGATQGGAGFMSHATNVPGLILSRSEVEGTSGVLSAPGNNVHLDSGTQMTLTVAAQR